MLLSCDCCHLQVGSDRCLSTHKADLPAVRRIGLQYIDYNANTVAQNTAAVLAGQQVYEGRTQQQQQCDDKKLPNTGGVRGTTKSRRLTEVDSKP